MLQDLADDAYIVRPAVLDNLRRVADTRLVFEYLTFTRHLDHVVTSLQLVPGLRAIVDHLSKPPIGSGALSPWAERIAAVAAFPNVSCKVSGMVTEADHRAWRPADLEPYVAHVLDVFGPRRLVWGSDWPVALLAADYERVHDTAQALLEPRVSAADLAAIFGGNAQRLYGLGDAA
jgi:L-fuconolactonase